MSIFDIFSKKIPQPKTYEEAYNLAYDFLQSSPKKAIKVIKSIYEQNLPVKKEDIFFVNSIAALATRPIFREIEIGKNLLEKVVSVKIDDFMSNSPLFYLALEENNTENVKRYAKNLLKADYKAYIKQMEWCKESEIPEVRNYLQNTAQLYQQISAIFLDEGNEKLGIKAIEIAHEINPTIFNNTDEIITALVETALSQTNTFISKVQNKNNPDDHLSLLKELDIISIAIVYYHLKNNGVKKNIKKELIKKYTELMYKQSGAEELYNQIDEILIYQSTLKLDYYIDYLGLKEKEFSKKILKTIDELEKSLNKEICIKDELEKHCNYLIMAIKSNLIYLGIMDK